MKIRYLEMEGAGNRILIVDERRQGRSPPANDRIRWLGDDDTGPGFDQLMWLLPAGKNAVASYRVFNRDGSEVEQCGNGVRCVARYLATTERLPESFLLESPSGAIEARLQDDGRVSVNMGRPRFDPAAIPFVADREADFYDLELNGEILRIGAVSMGNPHCVLEVDATATAPVAELGPLIEHHERFPERCNAGFMARRSAGEIDLRVFERGVGETRACGTGACAAVVTGRRRGQLDAEVRVNLPGGQLVVSWPHSAQSVWLTGNAESVGEGTINL